MTSNNNKNISVDLNVLKGDQTDVLKDFSTAARSLADQLSAFTGKTADGAFSSRVGQGRASRSMAGAATGGFAGGSYIGNQSDGTGANPHGVGHQSNAQTKRQKELAAQAELTGVQRHSFANVSHNNNMLDSLHMASGSGIGKLKYLSAVLGAPGATLTSEGKLSGSVGAKISRYAGGAIGMTAKAAMAAGVISEVAQHSLIGGYSANQSYGQLGYGMGFGSGGTGISGGFGLISGASQQRIQSDLQAAKYTFDPYWGSGQEKQLQSNLIEAGINPNDDSGKKFANMVRGISKGGIDSGMATQMLIGTERTGTPDQLKTLADVIKNLGVTAKSTGVSVAELQKNLDATSASLNQSTAAGQATTTAGAGKLQMLLGKNTGSESSLVSSLLANPAYKFGASQQAGGALKLASHPQDLVNQMMPMLAQVLGAGSTQDLQKNWSKYQGQYAQLTLDNPQFASTFGGGLDVQQMGKLMTQFPKRNAADQLRTSVLAGGGKGLSNGQMESDADKVARTFMSAKDYQSWQKKEKGKTGLQMLSSAEPGASATDSKAIKIEVDLSSAAKKLLKVNTGPWSTRVPLTDRNKNGILGQPGTTNSWDTGS